MNAVDICNLALDQIGSTSQITGISPPLPASSLAAQVASRNYQRTVDTVSRAAHWNCLRLQAGLTLLRAAIGTPENPSGAIPDAPQPWLYEYALPTDCVKVRFVFPLQQTSSAAGMMTNMLSLSRRPIDASMPFTPAVDRDASGNQIPVILTNARMAQIVYTGRIANPDLWDPGFRDAVIATLAAWFVNPINRNKELLAERVQMARALVEQARIADGNEGITQSDIIPDWFQVRDFGGWGWGWCGEGRGYVAGWDAMTMPNGISF